MATVSRYWLAHTQTAYIYMYTHALHHTFITMDIHLIDGSSNIQPQWNVYSLLSHGGLMFPAIHNNWDHTRMWSGAVGSTVSCRHTLMCVVSMKLDIDSHLFMLTRIVENNSWAYIYFPVKIWTFYLLVEYFEMSDTFNVDISLYPHINI